MTVTTMIFLLVEGLFLHGEEVEASEGEGAGLDRHPSSRPSLHEHLAEQLALAVTDPADRLVGLSLIDAVDEAGYLAEPLAEIADRLGMPLARAESVLSTLQGLSSQITQNQTNQEGGKHRDAQMTPDHQGHQR